MTKRTQFVKLNDVEVAYTETGVGPLVLSAHGLTGSCAASAQLGLVDFAPVAEQRRLVEYDARGHGQSGGDARSTDYTWAALAADMLALADHLSPEAAVSAIGLSMGTGTVLHAVLDRPERFDCLVLTAPPTAWETRAAQAELYETLAQLAETLTPEELARHFSKAVIAPIFRDVDGYPVAPDIPHALLPAVFRGAGLSNLPPPDALRALQQPTLILAWDTDSGHPISTAARLAELLPHAQLHVSKTSEDIRTWGARAAHFLSLNVNGTGSCLETR